MGLRTLHQAITNQRPAVRLLVRYREGHPAPGSDPALCARKGQRQVEHAHGDDQEHEQRRDVEAKPTQEGTDDTPKAEALKILVVDDVSTDGTDEIAREHGAEVVRHLTNLGLGTATLKGFRAA